MMSPSFHHFLLQVACCKILLNTQICKLCFHIDLSKVLNSQAMPLKPESGMRLSVRYLACSVYVKGCFRCQTPIITVTEKFMEDLLVNWALLSGRKNPIDLKQD